MAQLPNKRETDPEHAGADCGDIAGQFGELGNGIHSDAMS